MLQNFSPYLPSSNVVEPNAKKLLEMGAAAAAIFVILVCLCSTSKADLLSKNKEPQQTPAAQVSPACLQRDQRCNLAQQILSAQTPHVQRPTSLLCYREEAQIAMCRSVTCALLAQQWEHDNRLFWTNSPAEWTALVCTSAPEEWHDPQSASSWSCKAAVTDTSTCAQKEGCDLCSWVASSS